MRNGEGGPTGAKASKTGVKRYMLGNEPILTRDGNPLTDRKGRRSYVTSADFYNLCVNYQVSGEYVTKAVVRVEGEFMNPANPLRTVVESFEVLPPFE